LSEAHAISGAHMALTLEERAARKGRITSSIAAAILGMDPYTSPYGARLKLLGLDEHSTSKAAERGNYCEVACLNYAADRAAEQYGIPITWMKPEFAPHKNGWSGASTDAFLVKKDGGEMLALVEAKTASQTDDYGEPGTDEIPDRHIVQCCWHLYHHPAASICYVPVLLGGYKFRFEMYMVRRNARLIDSFVAEARSWYEDHIIADGRLDPDHRDLDPLRYAYPLASEPPLDMTDDREHWAQEKLKWEQAKQAAAKQEATAKARIIELLAQHESARNERISITYRNSKPRAITNWRAVAEALNPPPEIIAQHTTLPDAAQPNRALKVTALKSKEK
jgi:predicted phage-related endonuclease